MGHMIYFSCLRKASEDSMGWLWDFRIWILISFQVWERSTSTERGESKKPHLSLKKLFLWVRPAPYLTALAKWNFYFRKWKKKHVKEKKKTCYKEIVLLPIVYHLGVWFKVTLRGYLLNAMKTKQNKQKNPVIPHPASMMGWKTYLPRFTDLGCPSCSTKMSKLCSLKVNA